MRRDSLEIIADILKTADGEVLNSISNRANLNFERCKNKVNKLVEKGLIEEEEEEFKTTEGSRTVYKRTEKGDEFLRQYKKVLKIIEKR